jgi:hypothetical protein
VNRRHNAVVHAKACHALRIEGGRELRAEGIGLGSVKSDLKGRAGKLRLR